MGYKNTDAIVEQLEGVLNILEEHEDASGYVRTILVTVTTFISVCFSYTSLLKAENSDNGKIIKLIEEEIIRASNLISFLYFDILNNLEISFVKEVKKS